MKLNTEDLLEEALDRTISLLWPPQPGIWLRIAIIVLFLGGGLTNPLRTEDIWTSKVTETGLSTPGFLEGYGDLLVFIGTAILISGLLYIVISSIFQFIFVDCLSSNRILLTRTFTLRWKKGLHMVGFYLILIFLVLLAVVGVSLLLFVPLFLQGRPDLLHLLITVIEALIILLVILIPVWIVAILTADFVVPVMIMDDTGIISGWKRMISLFRGNWRQVVIYVGLKLLIIIISGIILGIVIYLISIPMGLAGFILTIDNEINPVSSLPDLFHIIMGSGVMILISLLLLVPVVTFFRYYSLVILRELNPGYNLLPYFKEPVIYPK